MNLEKFTEEVAAQFSDDIVLEPDTDFRDNDFFDSLTGMSILVMIKDNFNYSMDVPTFLMCKTPKDLFSRINLNENESN